MKHRASFSPICSPSPKTLQVELDAFKWLGAHDFVAGVGCEEHPMTGFETVGFERFERCVEQPQVWNAEASGQGELAGAVKTGGRWREGFADPVRCHGDERVAWRLRQSLATPAGDVGHDNVVREMQLWLIDDPPAAGAAVTKLHTGDERRAKRGCADGVWHRGSGTDRQLTVYDLADEVLRQSEDVLVAGWAPHR